MDVIKVNTSVYYDNHYIVMLWSGAGYLMQPFDVYANSEQQAVEIVVAYCDNNNLHGYLIDVEDVEDEEDNNYTYIDATMEDATKPYYIYSNVRIEEVNND